MAVSFKVPASPKRSIFNIDQFLGVDMTNSGTSVDERMSPNAPNMIRDVPGKVRKRTGYKVIKDFGSGVVYGAHVLASTTTNTGDFVTNRNMVSTPATEIDIASGDSVYIYSEVEIPVGVGVHVSFSYKTTKALEIHPYVTDYSNCNYDLDTIGHASDFHKTFGFNNEVNEVYNAFEITNNSADDATLKLSDIMIYINSDSESVIMTYRGFQTVQEKSLYQPSQTVYTTADSTESISSTSASEEVSFAVNSDNVEGLVQVDFDISLEDLTGASLSSLSLTYNTEKDDGTTDVISTIDSTTHNSIHISRVIDPAYNHDDYDVEHSKLTDIVVKVNVKNFTSWTGDVKLKNFKFYSVALKSDYYEEGGLSLIHIDNSLYKADSTGAYTLISDKLNEHRSRAWQFENKLFIVDGQTYWVYDADTDTFESVLNSSYAHIPLMYIACNPEGGGTQYEDKNLLTNGFEQRFICDSNHSATTDFQLIFSPLTAEAVTAKVMNSNGEMVDMVEDVDFTVTRSTGKVTFLTAPGTTPIAGEDNVYITAYYSASAPMSKPECITRCTIGTLFGINGATDRLFLSGNPDYPNVDWHSDQYDPTFFPDTSYSKLGRDTSAIVGYTLVNNYLAAHKDENETEHNIIVREGDLIAVGETSKTGDTTVTTYDEKPAFKIINTLQGPGAIASDTFGYLQTEPLFLTRSGVFAITAQDITGEKYSQNRSFYVNGTLLEENGLEDSYAVTYNDMYFLFVNSKVYVIDGLQPIRTDKSEPYATRQYVCFYLTDIPATIAWVQNKTLYFGTTNGKICCFYTDTTALSSYNDNGAAIKAWWETADLDGKLFYKNKAFRYIAVRLLSEIYTTVTLYACRRGIWSKLKEKNFSNEVFSFSGLTFSTFTFNNDSSDPVMSSKMRVKKIDKARFKIENSNLNQPFGIHDLAIEYVENGNFRG